MNTKKKRTANSNFATVAGGSENTFREPVSTIWLAISIATLLLRHVMNIKNYSRISSYNIIWQ